MQVVKAKEVADVKIDKFPYRGLLYDVKGISVRWLSKYGDDGHGYPEYGLRLFTAQPGGEIPIHNHFYHQTMYILSGAFECYSYDQATDQAVEKVVCPAGTSVFIPSLEPHGMKNLSQTEEATFLCCICNVYDKEEMV
jgi:quercetin dioxygenase-like cupin family protein